MEGKVMNSKTAPTFPAPNDKKNAIILIAILFLGTLAVIGIVVFRQRQTIRAPAQTVMPADVCQAQGGVVFPGTSCPNGQEIIGTIDDNTICCRSPEVQRATEAPEPTKETSPEPTSADQILPTTEPTAPIASSPTSTPGDQESGMGGTTLTATPVATITSGAVSNPATATSSPTDIVVILATNTPTPKSGGIGGAPGSQTSSPTPTTKPSTATSATSPSKTPTQAPTGSSSSSSTKTPTTKPTLPASGLPHASFLILSLGLLVIALGLAL